MINLNSKHFVKHCLAKTEGIVNFIWFKNLYLFFYVLCIYLITPGFDDNVVLNHKTENVSLFLFKLIHNQIVIV